MKSFYNALYARKDLSKLKAFVFHAQNLTKTVLLVALLRCAPNAEKDGLSLKVSASISDCFQNYSKI